MPTQPCLSSHQGVSCRSDIAGCGRFSGDRLQSVHRVWQMCEEMSEAGHETNREIIILPATSVVQKKHAVEARWDVTF